MGDDGTLNSYQKKRDFRSTNEPEGNIKSWSGDKPIFVIQKHDASNLHYNFRLEIDGVLKSWAVPKGPSTDPSEKRLAIPTEDHPLEYADFEGVIPEDEYGAGTVLVWDKGAYRNMRAEKEDDDLTLSESYDKGKLEVYLQGEKIRGGYTLVRTGSGDNEQWLLIKMDDDEAHARRNPTNTEPASVQSGQTLDEIAAEKEADES